jgi:transposase
MNELLFPPDVQLHIEHIEKVGQHIDITVRSDRGEAMCPCCQTISDEIHGQYWRHPQDLACFGFTVQLHIEVRRFTCAEETCLRQTFGERFTEWLPYKARRTGRLKQQHLAIANELGGEAGCRLSRFLGMPISGDTLIREIRQAPKPAEQTARVVGVDDWAIRKGCTYGTILVDLEKHQPIDMLDSRAADVVTEWLQAHPEIKVISRDRGKEYIKAATEGAAQAEQVADRWHLLKNLREAVESFLRKKPVCLQAAAQETAPLKEEYNASLEQNESRQAVTESVTTNPVQATPESYMEKPVTKAEQDKATRHGRRQERYDRVRQLHQGGLSKRAIARQLKISTRTVKKYIEADECPQYATGRVRPSKLTPWLHDLEEKWQSGCTNATQLWREIEEKGFQGSRGLVARWAAKQRKLLPVENRYSRQQPTDVKPELLRRAQPVPWSAQRASWLVILDDDKLDDEEKLARTRMLAADTEMTTVAQLTQRFVQMVKERQKGDLDQWLDDVVASGIQALNSFANGIRGDLAAVRNALHMSWSNGQVEGQVNRLKFIKRQMYGRANFDLLRKRVLYQPSPS